MANWGGHSIHLREGVVNSAASRRLAKDVFWCNKMFPRGRGPICEGREFSNRPMYFSPHDWFCGFVSRRLPGISLKSAVSD